MPVPKTKKNPDGTYTIQGENGIVYGFTNNRKAELEQQRKAETFAKEQKKVSEKEVAFEGFGREGNNVVYSGEVHLTDGTHGGGKRKRSSKSKSHKSKRSKRSKSVKSRKSKSVKSRKSKSRKSKRSRRKTK